MNHKGNTASKVKKANFWAQFATWWPIYTLNQIIFSSPYRLWGRTKKSIKCCSSLESSWRSSCQTSSWWWFKQMRIHVVNEYWIQRYAPNQGCRNGYATGPASVCRMCQKSSKNFVSMEIRSFKWGLSVHPLCKKQLIENDLIQCNVLKYVNVEELLKYFCNWFILKYI